MKNYLGDVNHLTKIGFVQIESENYQYEFIREDGLYVEKLIINPMWDFRLIANYNGGENEYPIIDSLLTYAMVEMKKKNYIRGNDFEIGFFKGEK